jgi:hypothetical protein
MKPEALNRNYLGLIQILVSSKYHLSNCDNLVPDYTVAAQKTATRVLASTKNASILTWPKLDHFVISRPDVVLMKPLVQM